MLAHFLKSSHLLQIEEEGIEQFTGESVGISAIPDDLWADFKVDFHIVLKKICSSFSCVSQYVMCTTLLIVPWLICLVGRVSLKGSKAGS